MAITHDNIIKKTGYLTVILALLLVVIAGRIVYIQLKEGKKYRNISESITEKIDTIAPNKGNVYTADGSLLATSMYRYEIRMDVMTVKKDVFDKNLKALCKKLGRYFGKPASYYEKKIRTARRKKNRYLLIAKNLSYPEYQTLKSFPIFNLGPYKGGFISLPKTVREHPLGEIASRTIGYDYDARPGIEGAFAQELKGKYGVRLKQKIAKGQWKPISDNNEVEPEDGKDIITTLDLNMQDIAHAALLEQLVKHEAKHGTAILMEVATGEIKAIANLGRTKKGTYYEDRNYAIYESHEPGSTFKVASIMAALEDKVIDTSTIVDTHPGAWRIHNRRVTDSNHRGYGEISAARVVEVSSNVGTAKLIYNNYKDNPQQFIDRLKKMGLDAPLNVPIKGEGKPFIPDPESKHWSKVTLPWMSFGYGVQLTPLQTLTFYNAIANKGKMVRPKFVKEVSYQNNKKGAIVYPTEVINEQIASPETISKMVEILKNTVKRGTATNIYSPHYSLAGKTGTCQALYWTDHMYYIASFAGFFPSENPKYSCIVVIHAPKNGYYGNIVAGPVFAKIAHKIYAATPEIWTVNTSDEPFEELDADYTNHTTESTANGLMPSVKGLSGMDAISLLENMGLKVRFSGTGTVVEQSIKANQAVKEGAVVYLKLS